MPKGGANKGRGKCIGWLREHVAHDGEECLIWPFGKNQDGYGQFGFDGRQIKAHRWMCEAANGPAPTDANYAAHECGNGHLGCVNPRHLKWKTHAENTADFVRDGRARRNKGRPLRKLTHEQVKTLLNPPDGVTIMQLSQEFGISYRHAKKIRQGISWRDGMPQITQGRGIDLKLIAR